MPEELLHVVDLCPGCTENVRDAIVFGAGTWTRERIVNSLRHAMEAFDNLPSGSEIERRIGRTPLQVPVPE
jgi:hypothetical protein